MPEDAGQVSPEDLLKEAGLRITKPRKVILSLLMSSESPLSNTEIQERLGEASSWDQATTYRTLITLRDATLAVVVSNAGGIARYSFAARHADGHEHAHFECEDCGRVECLPESVTWNLPIRGRWSRSLRKAEVQLRGACPDCLEARQG